MAEQQNTLKIHRLPFTQIPNDLLCSDKISVMAKTIWSVFYSKPDNWIFYWSEIEKNFKEGRDAIRKGAKQLEELGYLKKTQKRINSGKGVVFGGMEIELFPYPNQQIRPASSNTDFQHSRNSDSRQSNSTPSDSRNLHTNKDINNQDLFNKDLKDSSSLPSLELAKKFAEEEELKIDVEKWLKISKYSKKKIENWQAAMVAWATKPENQIKESVGYKMSPTETSEICDLRAKLSEKLPRYRYIWNRAEIVKKEGYFVIFSGLKGEVFQINRDHSEKLKEFGVELKVKENT